MAHKGDASTRSDRIFLADPDHLAVNPFVLHDVYDHREPSEATKCTII